MGTTIYQKLLQIQKQIKTFAVTEPSEKKTDGKSTYNFTPGWRIVETIREKLDQMGIMFLFDVTSYDIREVEYPVYKLKENSVIPFIKKEILATVSVEYRFLDTMTGESTEKFRMTASDSNGVDKSMSSAISLAERTILLKFFHITTREASDEPDRHDANENIPGLPKGLKTVEPEAMKQSCIMSTQPQKVTTSPFPQHYQYNDNRQPNNFSYDKYSGAVSKLANYQQSTPSFNKVFAEVLMQLNREGFPTNDRRFQIDLINEAQKLRNQI